MDNSFLNQKTPNEIAKSSAEKIKEQRKKLKFSQEVLAHNRDDHTKNFSFLYDENRKEWHLSPAYDLTYSSLFNGEHATTINGEGKNPTLDDIIAVAKNIGIKEKQAHHIALDIKDKCRSLSN